MKIRSLFSSLAAIAVLASTAFAQVYGPSTNLNVPASRPLKGDVVAGQDYSVTGPTTSGYIYALPTSQATSNALTAISSTSNTAATLSLAAPPAGKSWVFSGVQYTLAGAGPSVLTKAVTTFTGAASTDFTAGDTITVGAPGSGGNVVYTFRASVAATNDIKLESTSDLSLTALSEAINNSGGTPGTDYIVTGANPYVTSSAVVSHVLTLTAILPGSYANGIRTTKSVSNGSTGWAGATVNSGTPGTGSLFTIQDGTQTVDGVTGVPNIVYALGFGAVAGNEKISFNPPLKCGPADAVTLNLSAGGSSVYGILNANAYQQ